MTTPKKPSKKKDTWFKELREPMLKALQGGASRFQKACGPIPEYANRVWILKIWERLEASINKSLNVKDDARKSPLTLGILAAQMVNWSEINFRAQLKAKKMPPGIKKLPCLVSPLQRTLGTLSQRILRVMARQPSDVQIAFQNSYARALQKKMYTGTNPIFWETPATRLYMLLLFLAPWMDRIKSVAHLHKILSPRFQSLVGRNPRRLEKVCERIGLKFRKPGRPRNTPATAAA